MPPPQAPGQCGQDSLFVTQTFKRGTMVDGSFVSTGVSQPVFAENPNRHYLFLQNLSDTAIYVNFGAAATIDSNSILLAPAAGLVFEAGFIPTDAVNAICASVGKPVVAKQG